MVVFHLRMRTAARREWTSPLCRARAVQARRNPSSALSMTSANGEESENPLLNAPLPTEQKVAEPETPANPHRNPDLPEFYLSDIQTWPAQQYKPSPPLPQQRRTRRILV